MDEGALKEIKEALVKREANEKKLLERALRGDAREFAVKHLKSVTLHEAGKELVMESILRADIPQKDGVLDEAKLKESIDAEAKRIGEAFAKATGSGQVRDMGAPAPIEIKPEEAAKVEAERKKLRESRVRSFLDIGMPQKAAEAAADREEAA